MSRAKTPETAQIPANVVILEVPKNPIQELTEIIDAKGSDRFAEVIRRALSLYVWAIEQQALGKQITSLGQTEARYLMTQPAEEASKDTVVLAPLFKPSNKSTVDRYFKRDHPKS